MSVKIVAYSLKTVYGSQILSIDLSSRITEVVYNEYVMIDIPVLGLKKCNYFAYVTRSYIFDDCNTVLFLADYKKVKREFALRYLQKYFDYGRPNAKDYSLKTPKRVNYLEFKNQQQ